MNGSCFLHRVSWVMESHGSFDTIFQAWKLMESNCILMEFFLQQSALLTITYVNGLLMLCCFLFCINDLCEVVRLLLALILGSKRLLVH